MSGPVFGKQHYREMSLAEAVTIALNDGEVLRSLNATVVSNPQSVASTYDPSIQQFDPVVGYDAVFSPFDPNITTSALFSKNDDVFNNPVLGGGANEVRDDVTDLESGINKISKYGTQYTLRSRIQNSDSTNPSLLFRDSWTTELEGTLRQPLLQGRGQVNQILGPDAQPGSPNNRGILLALKDTQIANTEFEIAVREMIREIVVSYWELKLAYSRLEASSEVRSLAFSTWQAAKARYEQGLAGGAADEEALARAQYYRITAQVNADIQGNRTDGQIGVIQAEANLRRLLGMSSNCDDFIKPSDEPFTAPVQFDNLYLEARAIGCRPEVKRQMTRIEQLQLEIVGLNNLLLPRIDLLVTVRNNGFGDSLAGDGPRFTSAFQDAVSRDHVESEFGISYEVPFRFRRAKAAVRHARTRLSRERAILREQEDQIRYEVQRSLQALNRHQEDLTYQSSRLDAAITASKARLAAFEAGVISIDEMLIAQQQLLEAKLAYFNTVLSIQRSRLEVDFQSGALLQEQGVGLLH